MTGPDHFREAEQLLEEFRQERGPMVDRHGPAAILAAAHVHATLALAAATALAATGPDSRAWADAAGTKLGGA